MKDALFQKLVALCSLALLQTTVSASEAKSPGANIVFILADDLGWGELGCYGQKKIKTPNIDRLASEGVRFLRHYTGAPVCAPARCVLMTGRHLGNAEIRNNGDSGNGKPFPGQWPITVQAVTIAESLQKKGYATGGFGKWGLGPTDSSGSPIRQGFDRFYGYNCQRNAHSFFPPFLDDDEGIDPINPNPIAGHRRKPEGVIIADDFRAKTYAPDRILEEALKFIDANRAGPFFLYCPFVEPHVAMHPPAEWVDRYPREWDKEKGPYRGQNGYLPHPRPRAGYAAMISDLDEHVGAILNRLEKHQLVENTIVIFTSDNGTTHRSRDPKFGVGGVDADFFNSTAGLRGFKGSVYEGGMRVPCIVRWPGMTKPGTIDNTPSYFPDWFPSLCDVAGAPHPKGLDGDSLLPLVLNTGNKGATFQRRKPMIWEFHGYRGQLAVMEGKWKAVRQKVRTKKPGPWELYDLDEDPAETTDLASEHPKVLKRLEKAFFADRTESARYPLTLPK
ncbi:MAG TPA: sulfatase [Verrucomicrobiales bacterium]|nr:sulfatase [Verrucomicrobiales bacterium]|tara:strand:- start:100 stop:1611 length:1512 start_codon:yes stop_codon:yes gene_type:complete